MRTERVEVAGTEVQTAGSPDSDACLFVVVDAVYPEVVHAVLRQAVGFYLVIINDDDASQIRKVISWFAEKHRPTVKRFLLGFSLSACLCERIATDSRTQLDAGCSISSLMDVSKSHHKVDESSWYRTQHLSRTKRNDSRRPQQQLADSINYVQEYDFRVICKYRRLAFLDDYYDSISCVKSWKDIKMPYLFIMSYCNPIVE